MKHIAYFILILTIFASCQDEFSNTEIIIPELPNPSILVKSSFIGKIVDIEGNPIVDTQVVLGGETQFSNEQGFFQFDDVQLDRYGSLLSAEKVGYVEGFRRVSAHAGTTNYVEVILLTDTPSHTFRSAEGTIIEDNSGVNLIFDANSISTNSGQAYDGNVNVSVHYIDPTASNISSLLPGSLQGLNTEGSLTTLKSYSMISVELTDDQGQALQIKSGETVEIEFPVQPSLLNNAPDQIPLWFLDEGTGIWIEEGTADLAGDVYRGEVSHFTYWNCDIPEDFVIIEGNVCNNNSGNCESLAYSSIEVLDELNELRLVSQTDSEGNFTVFIPKDSEVTIDFVGICDGIDDQIKIGPFTEDQNLGTVEISAALNEVQLIGDVLNCDGSVVENGFVIINDYIFADVLNGKVNQRFTVCDENDITAIAINQDLTETSTETTLAFSDNVSSTFQLCEEGFDEDFIIATVIDENGNIYQSVFIEHEYQPCVEITTVESLPDSSEIIRSNFTSSLIAGIDFELDEVDLENTFISFSHGLSCMTASEEVEVEFLNYSFLIDDEPHDLSAWNNDLITDRDFQGSEDIISELILTRFGQNPGDVIEGSIKADRLNLRKYISISENEAKVESVGFASLDVNFRITITE